MNKTNSNIADNEQVIYHHKDKMISDYKKDPKKVVDDLVFSISTFLSCEVEPLSYHKYKRSFENDCKKALSGIFLAQFEKSSLFLIFPDIIPGFTTLTFKKNNKFFLNNKESKKELAMSLQKSLLDPETKKAKPEATKSSVAGVNSVNHIFNSFFEKNNQLVLLVESDEILMMFCPVSDFDKYIKQLEVYSL